MNPLILVINPGSTSTKIALYKGRKNVFLTNIKHSLDSLKQFKRISEQFEFRKKAITDVFKKAEIDIKTIDIIVCRGGLLKPIKGGVYKVNEKMLHDISNPMGEHESNLGGLIANELTKEIGKGVISIIVDPTCVDELEDIARISGMPEIPRKSFLHTLNQRAVARTYAIDRGVSYEDINVIVAHLGGGISVGVHYKGRIIDVNNGLNGDGPMSPERSGGLPVGQLVELCFSGQFTKEEILKKIKGNGGLCAYLGTNDGLKIEELILGGDTTAKLVYDAMAYQIAKEIGACSTVLKGNVDGILITGGLAYSKYIIDKIVERVMYLGPVRIYPGEREMDALAHNAYMALIGDVEIQEYV